MKDWLYCHRYTALALVVLLLVVLLTPIETEKPIPVQPAPSKTKVEVKPKKVVKAVTITSKELDCLIKNAYYEAGNQSQTGRIIVTQVVLNRANLWKKSFCSVIYQPKQFSWTLNKKHSVPANRYIEIKQEVLKLLNGSVVVPVAFKTATHFHAYYVKPAWSSRLTYLGQHEAHLFYTMRS
jgi:spore germination cell wall hydrolase CwlJ-like protein